MRMNVDAHERGTRSARSLLTRAAPFCENSDYGVPSVPPPPVACVPQVRLHGREGDPWRCALGRGATTGAPPRSGRGSGIQERLDRTGLGADCPHRPLPTRRLIPTGEHSSRFFPLAFLPLLSAPLLSTLEPNQVFVKRKEYGVIEARSPVENPHSPYVHIQKAEQRTKWKPVRQVF